MGGDRRTRLRGKVRSRRDGAPLLAHTLTAASAAAAFQPLTKFLLSTPALSLTRLALPRRARSRWEAWNKTKGMSSEVAKKKFVSVYFQMDAKANLYNDNRIKE